MIKEKLRERGASYKVLYAFSDFVHPETEVEVHEHAVNELNDGELIEDRFEGNNYRIILEDLEAVRENLLAVFDDPVKLTAQIACRDAERELIGHRRIKCAKFRQSTGAP